jgi:hypothetical protein
VRKPVLTTLMLGDAVLFLLGALQYAGVAIGIVALAPGAGPRTASYDLYPKVMLALSAASILFLLIPAERRTVIRPSRSSALCCCQTSTTRT